MAALCESEEMSPALPRVEAAHILAEPAGNLTPPVSHVTRIMCICRDSCKGVALTLVGMCMESVVAVKKQTAVTTFLIT